MGRRKAQRIPPFAAAIRMAEYASLFRPTALKRLALALLVPVGGLAHIAVLRAGSVTLEKAVPGDGDLVGAVRVLFQHVARDVAGFSTVSGSCAQTTGETPI